jgi:hypothetical protein
MANTVLIGGPGSGKTANAEKMVCDENDIGERAKLVESPHEHDLGENCVSQLQASGHGHRVFVDRLSQAIAVLMICLLPRPNILDPVLRAMQIERIANGFSELLARTRKLEIIQSPLIREWLYNAVLLILFQARWRPARDLLYAFKPGHPTFDELVRDCTDSETQYKFSQLPKNWMTLRRELAPAERLAWAKLGSPIVQMRDSEHSPLYDLIRRRSIIVIEGDMRNPLASSLLMSSIRMQAVECCFGHFANTGDPLPLDIYADEAFNSDLISSPEIYVDMAQGRKVGITNNVTISQGLNIDPLLLDDFMQMKQCKKVFRCDSAVIAERMAREVFSRALDFDRIGWTEEKRRQVHDGFDQVDFVTHGMSEGHSGHNDTLSEMISAGTRDRPRYREEVNVVGHRISMRDQMQQWIGQVMNLPVGTCWVSDEHGVRMENLGPREEPWIFPEVTRANTNAFYESMALRPEFTVPSFGENATMPLLPSSTKAQRPSGKSAERAVSPIERLRSVGRKLSGNEGGSNSSEPSK